MFGGSVMFVNFKALSRMEARSTSMKSSRKLSKHWMSSNLELSSLSQLIMRLVIENTYCLYTLVLRRNNWLWTGSSEWQFSDGTTELLDQLRTVYLNIRCIDNNPPKGCGLEAAVGEYAAIVTADAPDADDVVDSFVWQNRKAKMPYLATDSLKVGLWLITPC